MSDSKVSGGGVPSVQDTLGNNNPDNVADSSAVVPNPDGSVYERLEYIQQNLLGGADKNFTKQITNVANAGQIDVGLVSGGPIIAKVIIMSSNGNTTTDLNYVSITSGPPATPTINEHINGPTYGIQSNIDAERKQVGWKGISYLKSGDKIVIDLNGTAPTPVDLDIVVRYVATTINGAIV